MSTINDLILSLSLSLSLTIYFHTGEPRRGAETAEVHTLRRDAPLPQSRSGHEPHSPSAGAPHTPRAGAAGVPTYELRPVQMGDPGEKKGDSNHSFPSYSFII